MSARYVIVSPCRDEAAYMRRTLDSVRAQTIVPALWVVVDDGSTDASAAILAEYAARTPYLRVVRRDDRGQRSVGPGVVEAFDAGCATIDLADFDYLCKLDLDLELPPGYFAALIALMEADERLGTCSGKPYQLDAAGRRVPETCGDEMSAGMSKFYRRECFEEIGGFVGAVMWDGIDCHRCRMAGWRARSVDGPELGFLHLRPMGSSDRGILEGRRRHGRGQWFMGTGFVYMTVSALLRTTRPPLFVGGLAMWIGWVGAWWSGRPRYPDPQFRAHLRRFQRDALLLGKRRATARAERRHEPRAVGVSR